MSDTVPTRAPKPESDTSLWRRTKLIAGEALELPESERFAHIEAACAGDNALLAEVRALVDASLTNPGALTDHGIPSSTLIEALNATAMGSGMSIGRYTIMRRLGGGGMGVVFEANDPALRRRVALKVLSIGLASTGARRRFEGEAAALARLDHPNVARIYEAGVHYEAGRAFSVPYFAMEFVEGARTLDAYVRDERPQLRALLALMAHVCDAVQHGHQKGVLHRDLKPGNILVDAAGVPRVIDFGVSRLLDVGGTVHATMTGDIVGTPAYLPPEAFEKGVHALDTRADVYALGVVMHEVLSGSNPFVRSGFTPMQIGKIICTKPMPMLGTLRADCSGEIETIVAKATAREPEDRYQSVEQLGADLRRVLQFEPILARPTPALRQIALFARRNRAVVIAVTAITIALALGVAGLVVGFSRARISERHAIEEAARARRVAEFFKQMVRSANPFQGGAHSHMLSLDPGTSTGEDVRPWPSAARPGRAPTVADILAVASEQIENSFPGDVRLQAEMASMLAQTSVSLADQRSNDLMARAEALLSRAHGPDDRRTITARSHLYHTRAWSGDLKAIEELERDIQVVRARADPKERQLLTNLITLLPVLQFDRDLSNTITPLIKAVRADLDRMYAGDDRYKVALDLVLNKARVQQSDPQRCLLEAQALLERARLLGPEALDIVTAVLFDIQLYQRQLGDLHAALATQGEGTVISARVWGGRDLHTYEWWSSMYLTALMAGELDVAIYAAEMQAQNTAAMLGPNTQYTTKANGRLARVLLTKGVRLEEAERAARAAVSGFPDDLVAGDGWAVYHETLWAWSLRALGDPRRAKEVIERREAVYLQGSRNVWPAWTQILRFTELAQCEMDIALLEGTIADRAPTIEHLLSEAECYAAQLPWNWPSIPLARAARERFNTLVAKDAESNP